ncbi:MAG: DEAD/DEAH box helicase, partial [Acidimicrobiia bacterium]|nr:DEAD/DEAH box helicase [Acidimicrobiia bacterium]
MRLRLPAKRGTHLTTVAARRLDLADAIDALAAVRHDDPVSPTARAWAAVVRAALSFIADGRLLPWISADGYDTWRVDPLSPAQTTLVNQLAAALPPRAHATPIDGAAGGTNNTRSRLIADPVHTVRTVCDAVADRFVRTPAAHQVGSLTLFADNRPTKAPQLRPWVRDLAASHCASSRLTLQVHPPQPDRQTDVDADAPSTWTVRFQLRSVADPSLVIDAGDYWTAPAEVMARLGEQAEITLLAGLRQLGRLVPPLEPTLDQVAPTEAALHDHDLDVLLDALDELFEHGIDVRWPAELVAPRIERRVVASTSSAAPAGSLAPVLDMGSLLHVDWEFLLDGIALTAEELKVLSDAKRAVVPIRGKWVRLDAADRERLKARPPKLSVGDLLAAALSEDRQVELDGLDEGFEDGASDGRDVEDSPVTLRLDGSLSDLVERLGALTGRREQPEPLALRAELRPYQRRGLAWMADLCALGVGGCLADDMGLGKTIQVLALHAHRQESVGGGDPTRWPTLVVCPTSLIGNWEREAARFVPDIPVRVYHGVDRSIDGVKPDEIVLTSYGVVRGDRELLATVDWGLVVADEAQHAKNPRSSTARALRAVPARTRLALTGTPVENRLSELWSVFDWAVPGLLGPLATFRRTTAVPIERDADPRATRRLSILLAPFLLRRRKADPGIAPELPAKIERNVVVPLSAEQATLYKATVDDTLAEIAESEGIQRKGMVLALLTKLKQITNHPAQFLQETIAGGVVGGGGDAAGAAADDARRLRDRSGKLDALDELLATTGANDESTLIFTQYVGMGRILVEHLRSQGIATDLLHGGLSRPARQRLVDDFQARRLPVLVLSLKAGGTGLNLTAATNVVHYDRWWNPAVEDQATDRAYRIGQDRTVTVHRLVTSGTVEDRVAELLASKRRLADQVVGAAAAEAGGGGEAWIAELSDEEL